MFYCIIVEGDLPEQDYYEGFQPSVIINHNLTT